MTLLYLVFVTIYKSFHLFLVKGTLKIRESAKLKHLSTISNSGTCKVLRLVCSWRSSDFAYPTSQASIGCYSRVIEEITCTPDLNFWIVTLYEFHFNQIKWSEITWLKIYGNEFGKMCKAHLTMFENRRWHIFWGFFAIQLPEVMEKDLYTVHSIDNPRIISRLLGSGFMSIFEATQEPWLTLHL